jgi:hypothetical protein
MGYIKRWNVEDIATQIHSAEIECSSPYADGFSTWGIKQDLYQIKWLVDEALEKCPTFSPEEEWLKEQDKKKMWKVLSKK